MFKRLLLIVVLIPNTATAHDFNQEQWLQRWLTNRINIGECLKLIETDIPAFHHTCDLDAMVTIENKENAQYQTAKSMHPLDDALTFATDHFSTRSDKWIWGIYQNIVKTPVFKLAIINMYIVQGLTKNHATVHGPEGNGSTINE